MEGIAGEAETDTIIIANPHKTERLARGGAMRASGSIRLTAGAAAVGTTLLALPGKSAEAHSLDNGLAACATSSPAWHFNSSSLWTSTKKNRVRDAIAEVSSALDYDGTRLVRPTEYTSSGMSVGLADKPLSEYGLYTCGPNKNFWLNNRHTEASFYYKIARHEFMHSLGMGHVGDKDSMNSDNPTTLSTCIDKSTFRSSNTLSQGDAAYLNWRWGSLANRTLHANVGFEQGTSYWGASNGSLSGGQTGGATGPGRAQFKNAGTILNSYIYQTVRQWKGAESGVDYRGVLNGRAPNASTASRVRISIWTRTLTQSSSSNPCSYRSGVTNPNSPSVSSAYVKRSESAEVAVGTAWKAVSTPWWSASSSVRGYQIQVRAYGSTAGTSGVWLDNVRGEER